MTKDGVFRTTHLTGCGACSARHKCLADPSLTCSRGRRRGSSSNERRFAPSEHRERSAFAQRVSPFRSHPRGLFRWLSREVVPSSKTARLARRFCPPFTLALRMPVLSALSVIAHAQTRKRLKTGRSLRLKRRALLVGAVISASRSRPDGRLRRRERDACDG